MCSPSSTLILENLHGLYWHSPGETPVKDFLFSKVWGVQHAFLADELFKYLR